MVKPIARISGPMFTNAVKMPAGNCTEHLLLSEMGMFGTGIGLGSAKLGHLPLPHTDFIFSVIGEELGLWEFLQL